MDYVLDTNVAIHLRDGDPTITAKTDTLQGATYLSIITRVELEGGVHASQTDAERRRARLDILLRAIPVLAFDDAAADAYAAIIQKNGYSRRKVMDRMIAGQALAREATLVTMNPNDFRDVPGLEILVW